MAQKSPDTSAIPLCARHHRTGSDSYHKLGPRAFELRHGLDLRAIVARLNEKPSVRIEGGSFVGTYRNEEVFLRPLQIGLCSAVRIILRIKREDRVPGSPGIAIRDFLRIRERLQLKD
jgi:hypothetical protein